MNEYSLEYYKKREAEVKARKRAYYLKQRYHTTPDEFAELYIKQNGVCAICKEGSPSSNFRSDYDRLTGGKRGLLCGSCSKGISCFRDNTELMRQAVRYLESFDNLRE
jgi:hypothetical protein